MIMNKMHFRVKASLDISLYKRSESNHLTIKRCPNFTTVVAILLDFFSNSKNAVDEALFAKLIENRIALLVGLHQSTHSEKSSG